MRLGQQKKWVLLLAFPLLLLVIGLILYIYNNASGSGVLTFGGVFSSVEKAQSIEIKPQEDSHHSYPSNRIEARYGTEVGPIISILIVMFIFVMKVGYSFGEKHPYIYYSFLGANGIAILGMTIYKYRSHQ